MHLCYIDDSGTPEIPGVSSYYVLAGVSIPIARWREADSEITNVLSYYGLEDAEIHTGWMIRNYLEQSRIPNFEQLSRVGRRAAVERERAAYILRLQGGGGQNAKTLRNIKKNYRRTEAYTHLTKAERTEAIRRVADCVGAWWYARLFAECIDKLNFHANMFGSRTIDEQAFEQVASRFDRYMENTDPQTPGHDHLGLLVHDNSESVAIKHTRLMRQFHRTGTLHGRVNHIVETPLFVDSSLTRMVQIADLCGYALRRYLENHETDLLHRIWPRADRSGGFVVGVRHFTNLGCQCEICKTRHP